MVVSIGGNAADTAIDGGTETILAGGAAQGAIIGAGGELDDSGFVSGATVTG